MSTSFEELYDRKLKEEMERHAEDLAMGSANDYSAYREKVGYIKGMLFAADIFHEIANRARKENLDD
jgi:hypothetical protein